jgi:hypothetical protein
MTRELRLGLVAIVALAAFIFGLMVIGSLGGTRPEIDPLTVAEVRAGGDPADRYGDRELHVVGYYAELDADCAGDRGGADASVAWLQAECPLRVLLQEQPPGRATQAELERLGIRLAAPQGRAFPSRAEGGGPNLRLEPLVFVGHFDDATAAECLPERVERCRNTFVAFDYEGFVR